MTQIVLVLFFSALLVLANGQQHYEATIYPDLSIRYNVRDLTKGVATAIYNATFFQTGWDILHLHTSSHFADKQQAYAAGYLEGVLTHERITTHYINSLYVCFPSGKIPDNVAKFLMDQQNWMEKQISQYAETDHYWHTAQLVFEQYKGLVDGYNSQASKKLTLLDFHVMASQGDLLEITVKDNPPDIRNMTSKQFKELRFKSTHCSALIKASADLKDLFVAHNTWWAYSTMTRIYKQYTFGYSNVASNTISFSSYPGNTVSNDDFYLTSAGLAVIETTNELFDRERYKLITPESMLCWHRTYIANLLSNTGPEWISSFIKYNSGTYNNMWMVVDWKQFEPGKQIKKGLLSIVEQMPGYCEQADVSDMLTISHWASFNIPYFSTIRNISGYDQALIDRPNEVDELSYFVGARPKIFRRDAGKVETIQDMKHIMRYNQYQTDPFSKEDPSLTIAARIDLDDEDSFCGGALDAKITSYKLAKQNMGTWIVSGPTTQNQPVFDWNHAKCNRTIFKNYGMPDRWNFEWLLFKTVQN
jgi:hypothetical protein